MNHVTLITHALRNGDGINFLNKEETEKNVARTFV
jgi:hypothetical protein